MKRKTDWNKMVAKHMFAKGLAPGAYIWNTERIHKNKSPTIQFKSGQTI